MDRERNPLEWIQVGLAQIDKVRFVDCLFYRHCLNIAVNLRWQGWCCWDCQVWKEIKK